MGSNLLKSKKIVQDVANTVVLDYAKELRDTGLNTDEVRKEVAKFVSSTNFIDAVAHKVNELAIQYDEPERKVHLH